VASTSRRFAFAAGLGLDAEVVRAVDRHGRTSGKRPGDLVFVSELARALARRRGRLEPRLTLEGHGRCALVVASNCDPYTYAGPFSVRATPKARFELGLDLVAPVSLGPLDLGRLAWWLLVRPVHPYRREILYLHDQDRAVVRCDEPTPIELDGEDVGDAVEVVLEAERGALSVLV
jgi:diacylglycerol kinase family enzyme